MSKVLKSSAEVNAPAYKVEYEESLKDIAGYGVVYTHKKSGARVCVISADDENKVFCVGFRTTPTDSTGVPHIIEHTVLCGSEKYPLKDPFIELCGSSLNTFLNAMTYPDKTIYPVASCNLADYKNLTDVYMDAVFHPNIYKFKQIFMQEGWHYELDSKDDDITLNGVVYSEMKGAFSSPDDVLQRNISSYLYPNTTYGVVSGGDPDFIPELTYEDYLDFHRKYYHPSNSYIFLYGDFDAAERLEYLDKEYLSKYDRIEVASKIDEQPKLGEIKKKTEYYNVNDESALKNATYINCSMSIGRYDDIELITAFNILSQVLFRAPGAPIKQALTDAGIGQEITGGLVDGVMQPYFYVTAKNADESRVDEFFSIYKSELKRAAQGLNKKSLLAALSTMEFSYREADFGSFPKGLLRGISMLDTWLYDDKMAFTMLHLSEVYAAMRERIETDYFEKLIEKYLLDSEHEVQLVLMPKIGLLDKKEKELKDKLAKYKQSLSEKQIEELVEETKALKKYQAEDSTKEQKDTLPVLEISDIKKETTQIEYEKTEICGAETVFVPAGSNGIAYFSFLFDIGAIDEKEIPYAMLLSKLLGKIDTEKYSYLDLSNEVNIHSGGMGANVLSYGKQDDVSFYRPMFTLSGKVLYNEAGKISELALEELLHSKLDDKKRIKEILAENKSQRQMVMTRAGSAMAGLRISSYESAAGYFSDLCNGIGAYRFVSEKLEHFDEQADEICAELKALAAKLFTRSRLMINIGAEKDGFESIKGALETFVKSLPQGSADFEKHGPALKAEKKNEGFKTAGQVQFVGLGGSYADKGIEYTGSVEVLETILNNGFLWNQVRVLGGAYGVGFSVNKGLGIGTFTSYRDPKLKETLETYKKTADYVESYEADDKEMTKSIIGAMGQLDTPMTASMRKENFFAAYMTGETTQDRQKTRDEILSTGAAQIKALAPMVRAVADADNICVIGNEKQINDASDIFMNVENYI